MKLKIALILLGVCYAGVVAMILFGHRLGYLRFPLLLVIGVFGFSAFHSLYACAQSKDASKSERSWARGYTMGICLSQRGEFGVSDWGESNRSAEMSRQCPTRLLQ